MTGSGRLVLAADVGATTTRLGAYAPERGPRDPLASRMLSTAQFENLESLVSAFLRDANVEIDSAAFAVAGPVRDGQVQTDSLPWPVDEEDLRERLGLRSLRLMNDVEAMAAAVPALGPDDLVTLQAGRTGGSGPIAVIGLGTGLGEAFLVPIGSSYLACASEGGHTTFAPSTDPEIALLRAMRGRFPHVSTEMVCSGSALPDLYAFVRSTHGTPEPAWLAASLAAAPDRTALIVETALSEQPGSEDCAAAVELLVSILGAEAGNLVLKVNATGGLLLGGGLASRILPVLLRTGAFHERLWSKGRDTEFLREIPVHVISNTNAGLIGAALTGLEAARD